MNTKDTILVVRRQARVRHGFTLVETIATMTILAAIGSVASFIIYNTMDGYTRASVSAELHSELSVTMDRIIRELRGVPQDSGVSTAAPDINTVTASSITWNTNYTLALSGTNLMYTANGGTARVLLADVTGFAVATYDESNTALAASLSGASCDAIRRVQFTITMQRSGVTESLRSKMFFRSTMIGGLQP
jgi:prepilin-type N-terminal cleavage/methylation domain-containing protein